MPWHHCGQRLLDNHRVCPTCGAAKQSWTTRIKGTKVLAIGERFRGDGDAQADALLAAADSSAPFCEECERAEQGPDDGWDVAPPPPESDGAAQAAVLVGASDSAAPFCEECQRAEQGLPDDGWEVESEEEQAPPPSDGAAQAAVLVGASESGTPFCEECQRAAEGEPDDGWDTE
jgi:hypothetical protein